MVTARLSREDAKENGWLLDGYPRSFNQAQSLQSLKIIPDVYIVLDVCESCIEWKLSTSTEFLMMYVSCFI